MEKRIGFRSAAGLLVSCIILVAWPTKAAPHMVGFGPLVRYVAVHGTYSFQVTATGGHLTYQWWNQEIDAPDGHPIPPSLPFGVNHRRLVVTDAQATRDYNGFYWCVVSNALTGETAESPHGEVFVIEPPTVTQPPESQSVPAGSTVSFTIVADPHGPVPTKYRWYFNGRPVLRAIHPTLVISSATARRAGLYSCRVRTLGGITMSDEALLTVAP